MDNNVPVASTVAVTHEGKVCPNPGIPPVPLGAGTLHAMAITVQGHMVYLAGGDFSGPTRGSGCTINNAIITTMCNYVNELVM